MCPRGYLLRSSQCVTCDTGDSNCVKCSAYDETVCTQCGVGYYLDENKACQTCSSDCSNCLSQYYCSTCANGYFMKTFFGFPTGLCEACDSEDAFCGSCIFSPSQCTTCISDEYQLKKGKCISKKNVGCKFSLNANYNSFMLNINKFKLDFVNRLGGAFRGKIRLLTFLKLVFGSVNAEAQVTVPAGESPDDAFNTLNSGLEGAELGGLPITSASVEA